MKKSLSILSLTLLLSVFAVACGADEDTGAAGDNNNNTDNNAEENNDNNNADNDEAVDNNNENEGNEDEGEEASEITVEHELGETVVPVNPENVVLFDFGVLDTLREFGVEPAAIPQGNVPEHLSEYGSDDYANAGTLFEPDFETIYGLDPELIIIGGRTSDAYDELSDIAPTIHMGVDNTNYIESFKENTTLLGEIFGEEELVEERLAEIDQDVAELNDMATNSDGEGLIVMTSEGALSAYGPGSRFGIIHAEFGVAAADDGIEEANHGQNVSFEYVVETDPDYLFVIDRGAVTGGGDDETAEETLDNELIQQTTAAQEGNIVYLDGGYWYIAGGGLTSVAGMIDEIRSGLE